MCLTHRLCSHSCIRRTFGKNSVITRGSVAVAPVVPVAPVSFSSRILYSLNQQIPVLLVLCTLEKGPWTFLLQKKKIRKEKTDWNIPPRMSLADLGSRILKDNGSIGLWAWCSMGKYRFLDLMVFLLIILLTPMNLSSSQWNLNLDVLAFLLSSVVHRYFSLFYWGWGKCSMTDGKEINQWQ